MNGIGNSDIRFYVILYYFNILESVIFLVIEFEVIKGL